MVKSYAPEKYNRHRSRGTASCASLPVLSRLHALRVEYSLSIRMGFVTPSNYIQWNTPRHRLRRIAHAKGERLPEEIKGTHHTKALPIDDLAQKRILEGRASKKVRRGGYESLRGR